MLLEDYLADEYHQDQQDIDAIEAVLVDVARTLCVSFARDSWPYELKAVPTSEHGGKPRGTKSQGTSAMILAALGKMIRVCICRDGTLSEEVSGLPGARREDLNRIFKIGLMSLIKQLKKSGSFESSTFGEDNPLTVSHLAELSMAVDAWPLQAALLCPPAQRLASGKVKLEETLSKLNKDFLAPGGVIKTLIPNDKDPAKRNDLEWCPRGAFVALKLLRLAMDVEKLSCSKWRMPAEQREPFKQLFEHSLHEQLSFSSIPDSRFDPAELAFSLEGMMLCSRESVDPVLFERVFAVLAEKQETSAYWRPNRPFIAKRTGEIMLPLSVEGANSLLRSVEIMDGIKIYETFAAKAVPMFRRFWQWLRARLVELKIPNQEEAVKGWASEHINSTGVIHLWDTSQIVEFLLAFRKLLQRHIARQTLILSGVKIDTPEAVGDWADVVKEFEPLSDDTIRKEHIFEDIRADFIEPWKSRDPKRNYSMLLYGPPGTGKTTVAKKIAGTLHFRLITITVSDFLGKGGAFVEARAKAIFQMLEAQTNAVILFDEIDAFLLDRDSKMYRKQDTLFQFLTPGMLTKINDLRSRKRAIFIIATNYENRIDPAIKRAGRIDQKYLLLAPDLAKRKAIIKKHLEKRFGDASKFAGDLDGMAKAALYLSAVEIIGEVARLPKSADSKVVIEKLTFAERSSSHQTYLDRLRYEKFPYKEFTAAAAMSKQAGKTGEIDKKLDHLRKKQKKIWNELMQDAEKLRNELNDLGVKTKLDLNP